VLLPTALPTSVFVSSGVSDNESHFIFSGRTRKALQFSEELKTATIIGDLPFQVGNSTVYSTTAISNGQDGVWLFAGNRPRATNPILLFNLITNDMDVQIANTTTLPTLYQVPVSVRDGKYGYLIGGLGRYTESDGTYYPTHGIVR
jgi:hypothetical protein